MTMSENREMYLLAMVELIEERCLHPVPLNLIAEKLKITSVSANEMVRKLEEEGFVRYLPYKGVELCSKGICLAQNVLRRRHLWEVFFVEKLGLTPQEADLIACRLEHVTPGLIAERLYEYLGEPRRSPLGKLIPALDAEEERSSFRSLQEVPLEEVVEVAQLAADGAELSFLKEEGLCPGAAVRKLASGSNSDLLVETNGRRIKIGAELANTIFVAAARPSSDQSG